MRADARGQRQYLDDFVAAHVSSCGCHGYLPGLLLSSPLIVMPDFERSIRKEADIFDLTLNIQLGSPCACSVYLAFGTTESEAARYSWSTSPSLPSPRPQPHCPSAYSASLTSPTPPTSPTSPPSYYLTQGSTSSGPPPLKTTKWRRFLKRILECPLGIRRLTL